MADSSSRNLRSCSLHLRNWSYRNYQPLSLVGSLFPSKPSSEISRMDRDKPPRGLKVSIYETQRRKINGFNLLLRGIPRSMKLNCPPTLGPITQDLPR